MTVLAKEIFSRVRVRWLIVALLLALIVPAVYGQERYEVSAEPLFGRIYPPGRWLPLKVKLSNRTDAPVEGAVIIPVTHPALSFRVPVNVPPKSTVSVTAFAYLPAQALQPGAGAQAAPVSIVEWHSSDGARLARADLLAQPDTAGKSDTGDNPNVPGYLFLSIRGSGELSDIQNPAGLLKQLAPEVSYPLNLAESEVRSLPRDPGGYGAVRVVVLAGGALNEFDLLQRQALLEFIRSGGVLVVPSPLDSADPTATWLAPYLPVSIIGQRSTATIHTTEAGNLNLVEDTAICEAVASKGKVVLHDDSLTHVAYQQVGLGRIIFTSFPISSLTTDNPAVNRMWRDVLALDAPMPGWSERAIVEQRNQLIEAMVGAPAAPFKHAVWIVAGYAALTLLPQCVVRGARRPIAFVVSGVGAIMLTAGVIAASSAREKGQAPLTLGRLATVELAPQGGGIKTELVALLGKDTPNLALSAASSATLQAVVSSDSDPAVISQPPFAAQSAGAKPGRIERLWQASAPVDSSLSLSASLQFRTDGIYAKIDNQTKHPLHSPMLVWNRSAYRLPDLPVGVSDIKLPDRNPSGDFTNVGVVAGESATLRGQILQAMVSPRTETAGASVMQLPPVVAGWIDANDDGVAKPLIQSDPSPQSRNENLLVTAPATLAASPSGVQIRIPAEFTIPQGEAAKGVLFDPATGQWLQSVLTNNWRLGFAVPPGVGTVHPIRARIIADVSAGKHRVIIRRGQCAGGVAGDNPDGPVVGEWDRAVGPREATFEINTTDFDANGCIWLRLTVEQSGTSGDIIQPQWKFNQFDVEIDARTGN